MKHLKLVFGLIIFCANVAYAGEGGVGNGGFVIDCEEQGKIKTMLYDYVDAKRRAKNLGITDFQVTMGEGSALQKVRTVLNRLKKYDAVRAEMFRVRAERFEDEVEESSDLGPIGDIGVAAIPRECSNLRPVIGQRDEQQSFPGDKPYTRVKTIWNDLNETTKAGLILHEVIYREALSTLTSYVKTSAQVRYFNSVISSNLLDRMTQDEYDKMLKKIGFEQLKLPSGFPDLTIDTDQQMEKRDGAVISAQLAKNSSVSIFGQQISVHSMFERGSKSFALRGDVSEATPFKSDLGDVLCGQVYVTYEHGRQKELYCKRALLQHNGSTLNAPTVVIDMRGRVVRLGLYESSITKDVFGISVRITHFRKEADFIGYTLEKGQLYPLLGQMRPVQQIVRFSDSSTHVIFSSPQKVGDFITQTLVVRSGSVFFESIVPGSSPYCIQMNETLDRVLNKTLAVEDGSCINMALPLGS